MDSIYHKQLVEGVSVPAIIHNSSYFLIQMGVYEDGTVSCWHKSDLEQFRGDLKKGWVVPCAPVGGSLSVHGLGDFPIRGARWSHDAEGYYQYVKETVCALNPEMTNLYRTTQRELNKWEKARVQWSASPVPCKRKEGFGYHLLDGDSDYIFWRQGEALHLTPLTVYADKTLRVAAAGDRFYTPEEIDRLFAEGALCTAPAGEEWVSVGGLGQALLAPPEYGELSVRDKQKEITDTLTRLSGEQDSLDRCLAAHYQYLVDPGEWTRDYLRKTYEAVPEHQRMYLGDMDTRDSDIVRILYSPEEKREV